MSAFGGSTTGARVAVLGSGNIGTDLMAKVIRSPDLQMAVLVGIDPDSDGLARAACAGVPVTAEGVLGLIRMAEFDAVDIVFDATSAAGHVANAAVLAPFGKRLIDLTPAALGPFVVPAVNLEEHLEAPDVNMVTCGGQATIPVIAAISRLTPVPYAEIIASIASRSAGPGTRANIDEFTETTAAAIRTVGGAERGKAIIVLNPAEPPLLMRDSVFCLIGDPAPALHERIRAGVEAMVAEVAAYVPGYRLKQQVQIVALTEDTGTLTGDSPVTHRVNVYLEVEGAGD